jgi:hypothetical protein
LEPEPRGASLKNRRLKHTPISQRHFSGERRGVFLSQAGPRFNLELVQAEHHLWFFRESASQTMKATQLGRPRLACYAAMGLACMPPSEGLDEIGRELRVQALAAWRNRCDRRRLFRMGTDVEDSQHHWPTENRRSREPAQGSGRRYFPILNIRHREYPTCIT